MTNAEIIEVAKALAWPVVVGGALWYFRDAIIPIEGELYDMVRAARLAENQLHEAVGNLRCAHDGESRYTEVPDYETAGLAVFAVWSYTAGSMTRR
jgi:hypothetical protein